MADIIFGSAFSQSSVRFYDSSDGRLIFSSLNVVKVKIEGEGESAGGPVQITDVKLSDSDPELVKKELSQAKVVLPTKISLEAIVLSADGLTEVISTSKDVTLVVDMVTKSIKIADLVLQSTKIVTSAEVISGAKVYMSLQQVHIPEELVVAKPEQGADADSVDVGVKPTETTDVTVEDLNG